jgi:manganese-transporting P-type ATPase
MNNFENIHTRTHSYTHTTTQVRPLRRLFHPAVFISMLGQACIHVFCMAYGVNMAKEVMGPEALKAVLDFHKAARAKELPEQQNSDEDPWAELKTMWMAPFKPNLLNTVVFLVETSQMIGTYIQICVFSW